MKSRFVLLALTVLAGACGSNNDYLKDSSTYTVQEDLSVNGAVVLSFDEVYLNRSIAVGKPQSDNCRAYAQDHEAKTGVAVIPESLKVSFAETNKHCARRNALKQCESYQYVYTFTCRFQAK